MLPRGSWTLALQPVPVPYATGNFLVPPEKAINKIGHGKQAPWGKDPSKLRPGGLGASPRASSRLVAQQVAFLTAAPPAPLHLVMLITWHWEGGSTEAPLPPDGHRQTPQLPWPGDDPGPGHGAPGSHCFLESP